MALLQRLPLMTWHKKRPSKTTKPEFEVIANLNEEHNKFNNINSWHVKGHQTGQNLSWPTQINNRCDTLVNEAKSLDPVEHYHLPQTKATIKVNDIEAASTIPMTLRQAFTTQRLWEYMQQKYKWNSAVNLINWEIHGRALNALQPNHHKTIIKFIHKWLPVNDHPSFPSNTTKCPIC